MITNQQLRKIGFYTKGILENLFVPDAFYRSRLDQKLHRLDLLDDHWRQEILDRVAYYHPYEQPFPVPESALPLKRIFRTKATYYFDHRRILRHFPADLRTAFRFGDVRDVSEFPRMVKTRPLREPHETSILMRHNSIRHFRPIRDTTSFKNKKDLVVWRGKVMKDHRRTIFRKYFDHPLCHLGAISKTSDPEIGQWLKPFMTVSDQLRYKFILSVEGNDVATNLKWISQSNSLCLMTKPKFESWFMEGTLKPGIHYVELRDDYSDLPEKLDHFLAHPEEALEIIANFKAYHDRFREPATEELIGLLVAHKYLRLSGQLAI